MNQHDAEVNFRKSFKKMYDNENLGAYEIALCILTETAKEDLEDLEKELISTGDEDLNHAIAAIKTFIIKLGEAEEKAP